MMDSYAGEKRNDALSQSYVQGVERVAQRSINDAAGFAFNLPKEVLQEREKVWCSFFEKYADEAADDVELNIKTMKPAANGEDKADDDEDDNEDNDNDQKEEAGEECYSKCRAPIRKLPALIQYWVDTGNPPYQLVGAEDDSETGSSLSEGECSGSGKSAIIRGSIRDSEIDEENSGCSSVDTAAYVRANANTTERGRTMEITEGAKSDVNESNPKVIVEVPSATGNDRSVGSPAREVSSTSETNQRDSLTLSEVLPALQQFDELLEMSKQRETEVDDVPTLKTAVDVEKSQAIGVRTRQSCQESSAIKRFSNATTITNRRKLYTGRNSPIDLIPVRRSIAIPTMNFLPTICHPALEPIVETTMEKRSSHFANRVRARRKRKRAPRRAGQSNDVTESISHDGDKNNSRDVRESVGEDNNDSNNNKNVETTNNRTKKDHQRYTNFFESLGLTPSKTIIERKDSKIPEKTKRETLEHRKREKNDSKVNEVSLTSENNSKFPHRGSDDLLGDRVLNVRLVRLSEEKLARYRQSRETPLSRDTNFSEKNSNIELLTTMTHDSDSSTILICSCNRNDANSDETSNYDSLSSAKKSTNEIVAVPEQREAERVKDPINERQLAVKLVKLPIGEERDGKELRRERRTVDDPRVESPSDNSTKNVPEFDSPIVKSIGRSDAYSESKRKNAARSVTIGSRIFEEFGKAAPISRTERRTTTSSCRNENVDFRAFPEEEREKKKEDEDDDDDVENFTRLVRKVATTRSADAENLEKSSNSPSLAGEGENIHGRPRRSRGLLKIAITSDEDEIESPRSSREAGPVTRGRKLLSPEFVEDETLARISSVNRGKNRLEEAERDFSKNLIDELSGSRRDESYSKKKKNGRILRWTRDDVTATTITRTKNVAPIRFQTRLDSDSESDFEKRLLVDKNIESKRNNEFDSRTDVFPVSRDSRTNVGEKLTVKRVEKNPSIGIERIANANDLAKKVDFSESPKAEKNDECRRGASTRKKERTSKILRSRVKYDESDDTDDDDVKKSSNKSNAAERLKSLCDQGEETIKPSENIHGRSRRSRGLPKIAPSSDKDETDSSRYSRETRPVIRGKKLSGAEFVADETLARRRISSVSSGKDRLEEAERDFSKNFIDEMSESRRNESCSKREKNANDLGKKIDLSQSPRAEKSDESRRGAAARKKTTKKKNGRSKILRSRIQYDESDDDDEDDDDDDDVKKSWNLPKAAERSETLCSEGDKILKRSRHNNADASDDEEAVRRKKRKDSIAKNKFLDVIDDPMDRVDLLTFSDDGRSRDIDGNADMKNFHHETPKIRKNLIKPRQSTTMTFRTKLINDSDDDDSDVGHQVY